MTTPNMRWGIAAMLCLATMINYADRLALSVVSVEVRREFSLDERDYSHILSLFMLAYAIMYAGSGYIVDRLGTRRGFSVFILGWSVAQMLHGLAVGKWSMGACRFLLGLAEPGNWPAAAKAVAEWFPASQRALGVGIFNAGSSLGSAIAPPMVAFITGLYGWRASFLITGALGLVWLCAWLLIYRSPEGAGQAAEAGRPQAEVDWKRVVRRPGCYTLILTRFFTDPV
ncbi:MAG: MFS transporter, partial [Bryobacteraceae bacterium]